MDLKSHIGLKIKAARQRKGMTQEQLAEEIGKAVKTISNIERGETLTGLETLEAIGQATDVKLALFFEDWNIEYRGSSERREREESLRQLIGSLSDAELEIFAKLATALRSNPT